ncbi:ABC transporter permease [Pseudoalteromonas sp. SMS1]|uniref:ABC transporter permease n=1 Tax=Pseudoalteromonas sp. SMS1 TaxID=2908894 RepID=UPI001F35271C|nr:ABC transporter permease [Pseudoalteromonas sp. SMS1]MCF2857594.1 ABC transporter permease [Pseudoalteromonas sp. SMS1]
MSFWIDIKYAFRLLMKKPIFSITSVLIVAIGLGLTVYTYSLLSQLIFKPLTMQGNTPLVAIEGEFREAHGRGQRTDPYHLNHISEQSRLIERMSVYRTGTTIISGLGNDIGSRKLHSSYSQWNLFEVAGVQPQMGRGFSPADQEVGAEPVIVLSHDVWTKYLGKNPDIIGSNIRVNGVPKRVIGVMPAGFSFPSMAQVWEPLLITQQQPAVPSDAYGDSMYGVARLKERVSIEQFQQELKGLLQQQFQSLSQKFAWRASSPGGYIRAFPYKLTNDSVANHYTIFVAMLVVVALILFLTCINVGNLLLARVNERIKEVAIRIALGIPKKRLILQMLWESLFICIIGGLVAWLFALMGVRVTNAVFDQIFAVSDARPFWWYLSLNFDAAMVLVAAVVFMIVVTGFIPAWRALSGDVNSVLRDGTRGALGKKAGRANKALVVTEIALSSVVLVVATVLLYTSYSSQNADYGVDTENRITAQLLLPTSTYPRDPRDKRNDFYYQLKDNLEQNSNINQVAYFTSLPGTGGGSSHFEIQGKEALVYNENPMWNFELVSRGAWDAVGMEIIEGRDFDIRDLENGGSPAIINESMARDLFPNGDAIGQRVRTVDEGDWHTEWRTIIGIVSDSVHGPTMKATSAWHTGYGVMDLRSWTMEMVVHYSGSQAQAEAILRETIAGMDPDVTVHYVQSYDKLISQPMQLVNAVNTIFLWCGLVALFLAASGIYAVSANSITLRSQEIATRRALGASNSRVINLFMKEAGLQLMAGLIAGICLSLWVVNQISQSMLIGGDGYIIGLVGIPVFITLMVLTATYIPCRKITSQEPSEGLRQI